MAEGDQVSVAVVGAGAMGCLFGGLLADGAGLRPARVDAVGRRLRDSARLALMLGIPAMFVAELIHQLWPSG